MPSAVGLGLVALDVVVDDQSRERIGASAGGSCGNVIAILAYMGWDAAAVARLAPGDNADAVERDLVRRGVDPKWLRLMPHAPTPVYVERLRVDEAGVAHHRFERFCPECGTRLPQYRAVTRETLAPLLEDIAAYDVLYIDRPSAGAVAAADAASERGAFVCFEPSARGDERQLARIAAVADVVKYSSDRLNDSDREALGEARPPLEIETLGSAGLRYRLGGGDWIALGAPRVEARDTAGAGDWTTGALLHYLNAFAVDVAKLTEELANRLLSLAQGIASTSCMYIGPRGLMDHIAQDQLLALASGFVRTSEASGTQNAYSGAAAEESFSCLRCG